MAKKKKIKTEIIITASPNFLSDPKNVKFVKGLKRYANVTVKERQNEKE